MDDRRLDMAGCCGLFVTRVRIDTRASEAYQGRVLARVDLAGPRPPDDPGGARDDPRGGGGGVAAGARARGGERLSGFAFYDARCPFCGAHVGWSGRVTDCPPCPRCGQMPKAEKLAADQAEIDDFRQLLKELRDADAGWERWREARLAAGLTLRQAAKLIDVPPSTLEDIEQGRAAPMPGLLERMRRCYGGEAIEGTTEVKP